MEFRSFAPTTAAAAIWAAAMEQAAQLVECEHISETHPSNNGKIVKRIAEHIRALKLPAGLT